MSGAHEDVGHGLVRRFRSWLRFWTPRELQGIVFWVPIALLIAAAEIAGTRASFGWYTISHTTGHLEDRWHIFALVVVILIAAVVFFGVAYSGKLRSTWKKEDEQGFSAPVLAYQLGLVAIVVAAGFTAHAGGAGKLVVSYWIFGMFIVFGIALPSLYAWRYKAEPTLFSTVRALWRRFGWFRFVLAAGMAVLTIHLAIYPWPDISHESTRVNGLSGSDARTYATAKVTAPLLTYRSEQRGEFGGSAAWLVYFERATTFDSGCVVAVTSKTGVTASPECSS